MTKRSDLRIEIQTSSIRRNTLTHSIFLARVMCTASSFETGVSLTAGIQESFARRYATDPDFRDNYTVDGINWGRLAGAGTPQALLREKWERERIEFFRYYGLRASGNFSLGSHDEWNIFQEVNRIRRNKTSRPGQVDGDVSSQLAGFFDGLQLDPASTELPTARGYADLTSRRKSGRDGFSPPTQRRTSI